MENKDNGKKKRGRVENLITLDKRSTEERKEICRKGGFAAAETARRRREMLENKYIIRDYIRGFMARKAASDAAKKYLKENGIGEDDEYDNFDNLTVFVTRMFALMLKGDKQAGMILMSLGAYSGEEIRDDLAEDRKHEESKARVEAIRANINSSLDVGSGDDEGSIRIYIPQIAEIREAEEEDDEER